MVGFTTAYHVRVIDEGEDLPGGKDGVWVVMDSPAPLLPSSSFFQPNRCSEIPSKAPGFQGLPTEQYTPGRWAVKFQVLDAKAIKKPMLSPEGVIRTKGDSLKSPDCNLPSQEPMST